MYLASAVAAEEVAVVAAVALNTPCCHLSHTPEPLPVGHPVRTLVLGRFAAVVVAAGRDNHWAEVDLGNQLAAGSVAVAAVVVGPNVWTMKMTTVCS